jgi:hypothetical protein
MAGVYAADGSLNVTVVDGNTRTGLYAADGSLYVVAASPSFFGAYHPCGAFLVTPTTTGVLARYAFDGSLYVTENDADGAQRITVVSGSFGGGSGTSTYFYLGF